MTDIASPSISAAINASTGAANGPASRAANGRGSTGPIIHAGGPVGAIDTALRRAATVQADPCNGHWQFVLPATRRRASVWLDRDWLTFTVALPGRGPMDLKRIGALLRRNARMAGCLRVVGTRLEPFRHLVCEIPTDLLPFDCDTDIDRLIAAVFEDLRVHLGDRRGALDSPPQTAPTADEISAMLEEAGWPARGGDGVEIPLDVAGDYVAAAFDADAGPPRLVMPLLEHEMRSATRSGRQAVTVLMWLAASGVRMVRARRVRRSLSLEACLPPVPVSAAGLAHGCAALSVAAQRMLAESRLLLADERLATTYLTQLGLAESQ